MKSTGTTLWQTPNTDATNESGFSAIPAGVRNSGGDFAYIGIYAFFWSATEFPINNIWRRILYPNNGTVGREPTHTPGLSSGHSVRCLRD
jgi:uncharacterized protein (TIGR02145 family)